MGFANYFLVLCGSQHNKSCIETDVLMFFFNSLSLFNFSDTEINTPHLSNVGAEVYVLKQNKSMYAPPRISGASEVSKKTNAL